jgi:hypothetical protein
MKNKKNKKFYNFTEKQKRKDRSLSRLDYAPSSMRKIFNTEKKAKNKNALRKIFTGIEVEFQHEKKNVNWWYF